MTTATAEKLSIYKLMDDQTLHDAVASLEETCRALTFAQGEIGARIKTGYLQALDQARGELERRKA